MKTIKLKIQNGHNRNAMVIALANAGYKVKTETTRIHYTVSDDYFIVFECPNDNVKESRP